ncbi:hypothetical protein [Actinomadura verrucosospora]|uniref:hypothetical protein n=1 Tax=Actinomadura verrucosospora TaxID=46165 RepID=UPI0015632773|nr:hypothetical protein [Actinomadura verrucosospora]
MPAYSHAAEAAGHAVDREPEQQRQDGVGDEQRGKVALDAVAEASATTASSRQAAERGGERDGADHRADGRLAEAGVLADVEGRERHRGEEGHGVQQRAAFQEALRRRQPPERCAGAHGPSVRRASGILRPTATGWRDGGV